MYNLLLYYSTPGSNEKEQPGIIKVVELEMTIAILLSSSNFYI